jgi:hypothetical protein
MFRKIRVTGLYFIFLIILSKPASAQSEAGIVSSPPVSFDSAYISDQTGLLTCRLFLLYENASLLLNPGSDNLPKIVYRPNVDVRVGIAGFWKWFGLGLSVNNPFYKTDRNVYGTTSTVDLRVNFFGRAVAGELFFQQYKSFYISSPERPDKTHYFVPDMRALSIGLSGFWIYNAGRFSIRAAFIQNEIQKKSAGSFVIRPSFLYYQISSDDGIVPAEIVDNYHLPITNLILSGKFYSLGLAPGYAYTLVFLKNFYLTAACFPGVAAQFSSFNNKRNGSSDFGFAFQFGGRFAVGYNSEKWFLGGAFQTGFNEASAKLNRALSSYEVAQFRFWGGTRFDVFRKKKNKPAAY